MDQTNYFTSSLFLMHQTLKKSQLETFVNAFDTIATLNIEQKVFLTLGSAQPIKKKQF